MEILFCDKNLPASIYRVPRFQTKRCEMSEHGIAALNTYQKQGCIIGESWNKQCWRLIWDGLKTPYTYNKRFIVVLNEQA